MSSSSLGIQEMVALCSTVLVPHFMDQFQMHLFLFKTLVEFGMNLIDPGIFVRILLCLNALACYEL